MTDLERDDRALIEALKSELIEARAAIQHYEAMVLPEEFQASRLITENERLNGVTEALEKTVKDLIAQHREAKDEVERERAMLKSECTGCDRTARLDDEVALQTAVREPVRWFAEQMEKKLALHDYRGGWGDCKVGWLMRRLLDETSEVVSAWADMRSGDGTAEAVAAECADVANFAMMIADNARRAALAGEEVPE